MGFIFNEVFWGILLIILGAGFIINVIFHVNLPIWRIVFAFIFIYSGVRLMMGGSLWREGNWERPDNTTIFQESHMTTKPGGEYSVIFGSGNFDFPEIASSEGTTNVKINTLFGSSTLNLDPNLPYKIVSNAVFAGVEMPDGSDSWFGEHVYQSKNFREDQPYLLIKADVIFGGLLITENTIEDSMIGNTAEQIH
ncbi:MAG TPA: hypothetical protein VHY08_04415 [Bacillota bacterium]|nr:hypothetical protein [Bacillota bacterium]